MDADSVAAPDTGATAILVCVEWLAHPNSLLGRGGVPLLHARDPNLVGVASTEIPVGIAGGLGIVAAFAPEADIPATPYERAPKALCGHLDSARDTLPLKQKGADIPLKQNSIGNLRRECGLLWTGAAKVGNGQTRSASCFGRAFSRKCPNLTPRALLRRPKW